jgi:hypothetical protein
MDSDCEFDSKSGTGKVHPGSGERLIGFTTS